MGPVLAAVGARRRDVPTRRRHCERGKLRIQPADLLIRQGRYTEAAPLLKAALGAARAVDDHELVALVLREQGRTLMGLGRFEEASARFDDARPRFVSLGLPQELIALDAAQAECLMFSGRLDDALSSRPRH